MLTVGRRFMCSVIGGVCFLFFNPSSSVKPSSVNVVHPKTKYRQIRAEM